MEALRSNVHEPGKPTEYHILNTELVSSLAEGSLVRHGFAAGCEAVALPRRIDLLPITRAWLNDSGEWRRGMPYYCRTEER
jgi:hypothetical protein